ncbi:NlpC/P60 family protein [Shinella sp. M31]|uniref:NlpC/P60 family protein n=1 Tax=Shinella sp. M31 TaxID=3368615 RepID=UPI003BA22D74
MSTHWSTRYIGTPYLDLGRSLAGVDCWGLPFVAYPAELGITVPAYTGYASTEELAEVDAVIAGATGSETWLAVDGRPREFDIAIFRLGHYRRHLGIVLSPGLMLHAHVDCTKIERYAVPKWQDRLVGTFRHAEMAARFAR